VKFGDILDQWEKQGRGPGGTGVYDKDAADPAAHEKAAAQARRRRRLRTKRPDATLDLHGQTQDEARLSLENFFHDGKQRGLEKLLVIHGKGNHSPEGSVLSRAVREFIERCPFAGESGGGDAASGGSGVTWVLLKGQGP
jgi:DNA-nicking Smr family endonuclease